MVQYLHAPKGQKMDEQMPSSHSGKKKRMTSHADGGGEEEGRRMTMRRRRMKSKKKRELTRFTISFPEALIFTPEGAKSIHPILELLATKKEAKGRERGRGMTPFLIGAHRQN